MQQPRTQDNRKLILAVLIAFCVMVACQMLLVKTFRAEQISDAFSYKVLGRDTADMSPYYPGARDVYSDYVFNPGYVNYLAMFYRVTTNDKVIMLGNIAWTALLMLLAYTVAGRLFGNRRLALITALGMLLFPTFAADVTALRTELIFTALAFAGLALALRDAWWGYVGAGVLWALANFVRPVAIVFLGPLCLYLLLKRVPLRRFIWMPVVALIITLGFGAVSRHYTGIFAYQSTTSGVTMLIGNNDDADGGYGNEVFQPGKAGYIADKESQTFAQRDAYWRAQAIDWIKRNPGRFAALIPAKLLHTYALDTYAFSSLYGNRAQTDGGDYLRALASRALHFELDWRDVVVLANQAMYLFVLASAVWGAVRMLRAKRCLPELLLMVLIILCATGACILTLGGARYHYPYLPFFFMLAAWAWARPTQGA